MNEWVTEWKYRWIAEFKIWNGYEIFQLPFCQLDHLSKLPGALYLWNQPKKLFWNGAHI